MNTKAAKESIDLINNALESNLARNDWEKLEGNLFVGLKYEASKQLRKRAALALGKYLADQAQFARSIAALEHARFIAPLQKSIVQVEFEVLNGMLSTFEGEASEDDLTILKGIIDILLTPIRKPSPKRKQKTPRKRVLEIDLPRRIDELLPHAPKKIESKLTFQLLLIFDALNPSLTPEERMDRAAKILAPYVLKTIKEKRKGSGMGDDEKPDNPPAPKPKGS